jgi:hypothetical protein
MDMVIVEDKDILPPKVKSNLKVEDLHNESTDETFLVLLRNSRLASIHFSSFE